MSMDSDKLFVLCDWMFETIVRSGCSDEEKFAACMTVLGSVAGSMKMKTVSFKEYLGSLLIDYENNYGNSEKP